MQAMFNAGVTIAMNKDPVSINYSSDEEDSKDTEEEHKEPQDYSDIIIAPAADSSANGAERQIDLPSQPPVRFCRKCGATLLNDSIFCSYCGTKVVEVNR